MMKVIKTLQFINGDSLYRGKSVEVCDNGTEGVVFVEIDNDALTGSKIPEKIVKWLGETGRLDARELSDFIDIKVPEKIEVKTIPEKRELTANDYSGEMTYTGRSKKITSKRVNVLSDNGTKCKIQDYNGNVVEVAKSTLTI